MIEFFGVIFIAFSIFVAIRMIRIRQRIRNDPNVRQGRTSYRSRTRHINPKTGDPFP